MFRCLHQVTRFNITNHVSPITLLTPHFNNYTPTHSLNPSPPNNPIPSFLCRRTSSFHHFFPISRLHCSPGSFVIQLQHPCFVPGTRQRYRRIDHPPRSGCKRGASKFRENRSSLTSSSASLSENFRNSGSILVG